MNNIDYCNYNTFHIQVMSWEWQQCGLSYKLCISLCLC